jgi:hypothetical protein
MKEDEDGYISFVADGGDVRISGLTGRCYGKEDKEECVRQLVRKMVRASETPPYYVRYMTEAVLQRLLQMANEIGWMSSVSAGASIYLYSDVGGPELTLDVAVAYGAPPKAWYSEEDHHFANHENEWYATIESCYCGFETHYSVERILHFGRNYDEENPLSFDLNRRILRRAVIMTVKQAYNAKPVGKS